MMWSNHGAWGAGDWVAMGFMMLVFWGLLVALVVWLVRSRNGRDNAIGRWTSSAAPRADDVLAERFARGEIDPDEYGRRRALLHDTTSRS